MFATHPPIAKRIEALARYAGGRIEPPGIAPTPAVASPRKGPWG
jgi:hypothetical protein